MVFAAPDGQQLIAADNRAAIESAVAGLKQAPQVAASRFTSHVSVMQMRLEIASGAENASRMDYFSWQVRR